MEAKNLRIGNWVTNKLGEKFTIKANDLARMEDDIEKTNFAGRYPEGMPLTREWLVKGGFNDEKWLGCREFSLGWFVVEIMDWNEQNEPKFYFRSNDGNLDKKRIEFLHELQNLYFVLVGKEIVFN